MIKWPDTNQPALAEQLAYRIAGLLALDSMRSAEREDPYVAVLFMAGELGER